MKPAPLDVAVVGVGHLGKIHARVLSEIPGVRLVAVADADPVTARAVAAERKTLAVASVAALPAGVRAAVVATPTIHHHRVACELIDRGIACMVEKPLAATVAEAEDLVARAARAGVVLMVGHVERFNPAVIALLQHELHPRFVEAQRVSPYSFRSRDIGVVFDLMIHDIDIILHLVGSPVTSVDAVGVNVIGKHEDLANARIGFANGAVATVTASRVALKTERKLRLFAPDCYVTVDLLAKSGRIIRPGPKLREGRIPENFDLGKLSPLDVMMRDLLKVEKLEIRDVEPLRAEDDEFLAAVRESRAPAVTGEHGVRAMRAADMVVASIGAHASDSAKEAAQ